MSDITDRLRRWTISTDAVPASDLMDEAANEIARLRLTDAERETVERVAATLEGWKLQPRDAGDAATLRGLLDRMK